MRSRCGCFLPESAYTVYAFKTFPLRCACFDEVGYLSEGTSTGHVLLLCTSEPLHSQAASLGHVVMILLY